MLAYLISAYCDPDHVKQLIDALDVDADFYVHIDARVDDAPFRRLLPDKVHYVKRHPVSWGGYEQVEYQRELLLAAVESGQPYSHVVCLSGRTIRYGVTSASINSLPSILRESLSEAIT